MGNWRRSSRIHAGARLVARVQVVAERLDDPVGGGADVRRALLAEQEQQLLDEAADARQLDRALPEDRRPGRVEGAEQLVGGVDQVDLHRQATSSRTSGDSGPSHRRSRRAASTGRGRPGRPPGRPAPGARRQVRQDRRPKRLLPADDGGRAVDAGLERDHARRRTTDPRGGWRTAVGGSHSMIVTGSVTSMPSIRTVAIPREPTPTGLGRQHPYPAHVAHPDRLALDVRGDVPDSSIGASMTTSIRSGSGGAHPDDGGSPGPWPWHRPRASR